jgi:hypothetical protein
MHAQPSRNKGALGGGGFVAIISPRYVMFIFFSYDVMQTCWKERPADRPSFNALRDRLARHLEMATEDYGYLNLNLAPHMSRTSTFSGDDV